MTRKQFLFALVGALPGVKLLARAKPKPRGYKLRSAKLWPMDAEMYQPKVGETIHIRTPVRYLGRGFRKS